MATMNLRFAFEKRPRARCASRKLARMASQLSRRALARSTFASRHFPMGRYLRHWPLPLRSDQSPPGGNTMTDRSVARYMHFSRNGAREIVTVLSFHPLAGNIRCLDMAW